MRTCRFHGSGTEASKEAAQRRLAAMVDMALGVHERTMERSKSDGLKLKAAASVLDRVPGFGKTAAVKLDVGGLVARISELTPEQAAELARALEEGE
jgi:hypothetical protein